MKKYLIFLILCLSAGLQAQQIPMISQYNLNHYSIIPAAAGATEGLPLTFIYRKQWSGINGSPSASYLFGDINVGKSMGVGTKFYSYVAGPLRKTGLELTYSYHLELDDENILALGLSGLIYQFHLKKSELTVEEPDDRVFDGTDHMVVPDASFGAYFYGERYYAGISVPQLFNRNIDMKTDGVLQEKQVRHYYILGGYEFYLNRDFRIEPSLLLKFVEAGLFQADINARAKYKDMFILGLSYRSSESLVVQAGFRYEDIFVGYSYDFAISQINTATFGSHEILLTFGLPNFIRK
ncbi:MAG: type IX secretion system membrane protein PorP/SprF [Bacteroidales bacterium]